jgi:hypothetical protein
MPSNTPQTSNALPKSILKTLREKVASLPNTVLLAKKTHALASFCQPPRTLTNDIAIDEEVWEVWDQKLNVLLPHNVEDLKLLVVRGKYGLMGLVQLLEHIVHDRKVDEGLLDGKIGQLINAIDRYICHLSSFIYTDTHCYSVVTHTSTLPSTSATLPQASSSASSSTTPPTDLENSQEINMYIHCFYVFRC